MAAGVEQSDRHVAKAIAKLSVGENMKAIVRAVRATRSWQSDSAAAGGRAIAGRKRGSAPPSHPSDESDSPERWLWCGRGPGALLRPGGDHRQVGPNSPRARHPRLDVIVRSATRRKTDRRACVQRSVINPEEIIMTAYGTMEIDGVKSPAEALSTVASVAVRAFLLAFPTRSLLP